jgi:hypothetical protein
LEQTRQLKGPEQLLQLTGQEKQVLVGSAYWLGPHEETQMAPALKRPLAQETQLVGVLVQPLHWEPQGVQAPLLARKLAGQVVRHCPLCANVPEAHEVQFCAFKLQVAQVELQARQVLAGVLYCPLAHEKVQAPLIIT